jgi:ATP-dependent helicase/nuclease subunit A
MPLELRAMAAQDRADQARGEADSIESTLGQAMHRLLEWAQLGDTDFSQAQRQAVADEFALDPLQMHRVAHDAQKILCGAGAWAWDGASIDWAGNEVDLSWQGQNLRLDRLVHRRDSGEWWVLDYKSTSQPQIQVELVAQLRQYLDAVQAVYPNALVRAAFLTASGGLVEPG